MEQNYLQGIIAIAKLRLEECKKPLSDKELCRHIVSVLKRKNGKGDKRHSSKLRFKTDVFPIVVAHDFWRSEIVFTKSKKYVLKGGTYDEFISSNKQFGSILTVDEVVSEIINTLKQMSPVKVEEVVKLAIEKKYRCRAALTGVTNDKGVDVVGEKEDAEDPGKKIKIMAQVKRFSGTVNRDYADKFIGAIGEHHLNNKYSKFIGLLVTTGKFSPTIKDKLEKSEATGVTLCCWDGQELAKILIQYNIGVNYSLDPDFWHNYQ